jgi:hypothetical protein
MVLLLRWLLRWLEELLRWLGVLLRWLEELLRWLEVVVEVAGGAVEVAVEELLRWLEEWLMRLVLLLRWLEEAGGPDVQLVCGGLLYRPSRWAGPDSPSPTPGSHWSVLGGTCADWLNKSEHVWDLNSGS